EEYLIDAATQDLRFKLANGEMTTGNDLKRILNMAKNVKANLDPLIDRLGSQHVVEQAAAADAFNQANRTQKTADNGAKKLDSISAIYERGWKGVATEGGGFIFTRTLRGVETRVELSADHLNSHDGQRLAKVAEIFTEFFDGTGQLQAEGEKDLPVYGP